MLAHVVESTLLCVRTWVRVLCVSLGCYLNYAFLCIYILYVRFDDKLLGL